MVIVDVSFPLGSNSGVGGGTGVVLMVRCGSNAVSQHQVLVVAKKNPYFNQVEAVGGSVQGTIMDK